METEASAAGPRSPSKTWTGVGGMSFLVSLLIFPIAAIITIGVVWFAPVWGANKKQALVGKIAITAISAAILFPVVSRMIELQQASSLSCSNEQVKELAAQIIKDKILSGVLADAPTLTAIRTVPNTDILTCRSVAQYTVSGTVLEQDIVYTAEWIDDGQQFYVQVRFE